jgi:hypothetical protein
LEKLYARSVIISGTSGNEIYCLSLKGLTVGEIVSVCAMGTCGCASAGGKCCGTTCCLAE